MSIKLFDNRNWATPFEVRKASQTHYTKLSLATFLIITQLITVLGKGLWCQNVKGWINPDLYLFT